MRKTHTKLHPGPEQPRSQALSSTGPRWKSLGTRLGPEWHIFHNLTGEDIDDVVFTIFAPRFRVSGYCTIPPIAFGPRYLLISLQSICRNGTCTGGEILSRLSLSYVAMATKVDQRKWHQMGIFAVSCSCQHLSPQTPHTTLLFSISSDLPQVAFKAVIAYLSQPCTFFVI